MSERGREMEVEMEMEMDVSDSGLAGALDDRTLDPNTLVVAKGETSSHLVVGDENDRDSGASRGNENAEGDEDMVVVGSRGIEDKETGDNAEEKIHDKDYFSYGYDSYDEEDPKILQKRAAIREDIRALYLSGTPLFTRQTLHDLSQSFKALLGTYTLGEKKFVYVKDLNGVMVGFKIETGRTLPSRPPGEMVFGKPMISYKSIQTLLREEYPPRLREAYCSLQVIHDTILRDHITNEVFYNGILVRGEPSVEDTLETFNMNRDQWERSEECRALISLVNSIDSLNRIKRIVAFACSSFENDRNRQHSPSSYQHALILTLRDALQSKAGKFKEEHREELNEEDPTHRTTISCYAQDPVYNDADKAVLKSHSITVLDDPDGFFHVDESTLVLSHAPNVPVKQITMDLALPTAMIWNRIEEERGDGVRMTDPNSSRLSGIIGKCYDVFEFPGCEENFGDVVLYVRRSGEVDVAKYAVPDSCP